jgi:hypothetical protein
MLLNYEIKVADKNSIVFFKKKRKKILFILQIRLEFLLIRHCLIVNL